MKRLFLLVVIVAMLLPSCKKINEAIDDLNNRVTELENTTIPTINEQIANINTSIEDLEAADVELKNYITALQSTAANLQKSIDATNTNIDNVKTALQGEISTAKADVLAQLEALRTELNNELSQINSTIATLQAKDTELEGKITELRNYVDTELKNTEDWATATFSTLEQYNALCTEIATIKTQIENLNKSISELETRLTTKINDDIANAVSTLNADIQQKVSEITTAYTTAIKSAKEEITAAYTSAIQNAINALDVSLKAWVGEQLANYYTIAEVEAKITALQTAITDGDATLQEELSKLKSQLETTAIEITAAYKKAIEEAINTNNGVIDTKIANEIASVNQRITNEVATINAKIAEIESRLDNVEAKIAELLARIQSVSYIPTHSDGKVTMRYIATRATSYAVLQFMISPKDAVIELEKVWESAISANAVYTETRTTLFIDMPIKSFEANTENGVITITISGENLSNDFFNNIQPANVGILISDGNNFISSEYIPMCIEEISDEIWYTSKTGNIIEPYDNMGFGAYIISNTYDNGNGVMLFNGPVTSIGQYAFQYKRDLTSIVIPNCTTIIGALAFFDSGLINATIGRGVKDIYNGAFAACDNLKNVYCCPIAPPIGDYYIFKTWTSESSKPIGCTIYVPQSSVKQYQSSEYWIDYYPYIKGYAF